MIRGNEDRAKYSFYSVCFCGNDGEEKTEFPAVHEMDVMHLIRICKSQGVPVLVDAPNFNHASSEDSCTIMEIGE